MRRLRERDDKPINVMYVPRLIGGWQEHALTEMEKYVDRPDVFGGRLPGQ